MLSCCGSEHVAERGRCTEQHRPGLRGRESSNVYAAHPLEKQTENPSGNQSGDCNRVSKLEAYTLALNSTNLTQLAYGIAANVAAVLLYGTNFVPVKRIELGDGESLSVSHNRAVEKVRCWLVIIISRYVLSVGDLCSHLDRCYGRRHDKEVSQVPAIRNDRWSHLGHRYIHPSCHLPTKRQAVKWTLAVSLQAI